MAHNRELELLVQLTDPDIVVDASLYLDERNNEPRLSGVYRTSRYPNSTVHQEFRYTGTKWEELTIGIYNNLTE